MSNKIQDILKWYNNFNKEDIVITTNTNTFELEISNKRLPHLLGMQYVSKPPLRGHRLYEFIKDKSDTEIYNLIGKNNSEMLNSIKDRVENFKYFMENLENAILVEQTHPSTKINSDHLLVEVNENKYLQIGIARDREDTDYFETFIVRNDTIYFDDTTITEPVISIEKYDNDELVPFSFDRKKELQLLLKYHEEKEKNIENQQIENNIVEEVEEQTTSFSYGDEDTRYYNIPLELKQENRWAVVRIISVEEQKQQIENNRNLTPAEKEEQISKIKKDKKLPISVYGEMADSTNSDTWASYKEAFDFIQGKEKNHTLAFALGGGYIGIDLDDIFEDGRAYMQDKENSRSMTADFLRNIDTYAELSPSGKGLHLIGKGNLPGEYKRHGSLEIYDNNRFFTMTGRIITDKNREKVKNINEELKPLYDKYIGMQKTSTKVRDIEHITNDLKEKDILELVFTADKVNNYSPEDLRNIYAGNWDSYGRFTSASEADYYMASRILYYAGGDIEKTKSIMLASGLHRPKWETFRGKETYLEILVNTVFTRMKSFYKVMKITAEEKLFASNIKKYKDLSIITGNNYNFSTGTSYKKFNNTTLNIFKKEHGYTSNNWITFTQIKKHNEEVRATLSGKTMIIKDPKEYCTIDMPFYKGNQTEVVKLKLFNMDNLTNAIEKDRAIETYREPIKSIEEITNNRTELETAFIYTILNKEYTINDEVLENATEENIIKAYRNADYITSRLEYQEVEYVQEELIEEREIEEKEEREQNRDNRANDDDVFVL